MTQAANGNDTASPSTPRNSRGRPFPAGNNANPKGRPKGARSKLSEAFLEALRADFDEHGIAAIRAVREEKPDQYLRVIASILPKEITGEDGGPVPITIIELVPLTADDGEG
ncbi:hypothetical protein ACP4J4_20245 (plasmid) [Aureimonas ureilytica]|uniref:hypothetical protein n=1 Tax=Aureimonas ureilytica TaxID=401562 RepID=UPI003CE8A8AB